jgi:hypothetical protein
MKTSFKKLTAVFLAVLMVMSVFSVMAVSAADTGKTKTGGYTVVLDASNAGVDAVEWKAWTWADGSEGHWAEAHGTNNSDITFDDLESNIIFAYFQWGTGTPDQSWSGKIAQSDNMTVNGSTFTVTNANGTVQGEWSGEAGGGSGSGGDDPYGGGSGGGSGSGYTVVLDASNAGVDAVEWKAWTWADGSDGHWAEAHGTNNSDITFDSLEKNIIFAYFQWGTGTPDQSWSGKIAQSDNMTVDGATFTVTNANGTVQGSWSGDPVGGSGGGGDDPTDYVEPIPGSNTVYLNAGETSGTWYVWSYAGGAEGQFIAGEDTGNGVYKFSGVSSQVIFVNTTDGAWSGRVGQTGDADSYVTDGQMFSISGETEGDDGFGTPITVYTGSWGEGPNGGGNDPTDPPVDPTDPPVDPTDPPVDPTDPPVNPTDAPVNPTDAPVNPTDAPVNPTDSPVTPTQAPEPGSGLAITTALNGATINTIDCKGTSVTVTYNLQSPLLLEDGQGTLYYDSTKLTIASVSLPNIQSSLILNKNIPGEARFNFTGVNPDTNSGIFDFKTNKTFVTATFNVVGSGATTINLDIEELDGLENGQQVAYYTNKVADAAASSITQSLANPTVDVQGEATEPQPTTQGGGDTPVEPTTQGGGDTPTTPQPTQYTPTTPQPTVAPTTVAPDQPTTPGGKVTAKKANPIKVKAKTVKVKASKLSKKALKIKIKKALKVTKAQGKLTYYKVKKGSTKKLYKKVKVTKKSGKITIKKIKLKKGKTYKLKIKVTAAGNSKYKKKSVSKVVKIKVK